MILSAEVHGLAPDARRVLDVLAETTEPAAPRIIAAAAGLSTPATTRAIQGLEAARLVTAVDDRRTIRHPLIREVVAHGHAQKQRNTLHAQLAEAHVAAAGESAVGARSAELLAIAAFHASAAGDRQTALRNHLAATRVALAACRPTLAAGQASRAHSMVRVSPELLAGTGWDVAAIERLSARANASAGRSRAALGVLEAARARAELAGDRRAVVEDDWLRMLILGSLGDAETAGRIADQLLASPDSVLMTPAERCDLLNALASCRSMEGRPIEARDLAREALELATATHRPASIVEARSNLGVAMTMLGREQACLDETRLAWRVARQHGVLRDGWGEVSEAVRGVYSLVNLGWSLIDCGTYQEALELAQVTLDAVGVRGERTREHRWFLSVAALACYRLGRWAEAARIVRQALPGAEPYTEVWLQATHARVLTGSGRFRQAHEAFDRARRATSVWTDPVTDIGLAIGAAELAFWEGRRDGVRAAAAVGLAAASRVTWRYPGTLELHAIRLASEAGDSPRTRREASVAGGLTAARWRDAALRDVSEALVDLGDLRPGGQWALLAAWCRAEVGRITGRDDPSAWAELATGWITSGRPADGAYALLRQAEATDRWSAPHRAAEALARAHALCRPLPARPLAWRIEREAARLGVGMARQQSGAGPRARVTDRMIAGLTGREHEVAELVAAGASNREIASQLMIAEKTAGIHVSNILRKLGVERRGEVAALVHRIRSDVGGHLLGTAVDVDPTDALEDVSAA
jgi:DNA-binding CsgD family transcriptional regulator/tetratricopeptide (TPR) repeat protein